MAPTKGWRQEAGAAPPKAKNRPARGCPAHRRRAIFARLGHPRYRRSPRFRRSARSGSKCSATQALRGKDRRRTRPCKGRASGKMKTGGRLEKFIRAEVEPVTSELHKIATRGRGFQRGGAQPRPRPKRQKLSQGRRGAETRRPEGEHTKTGRRIKARARSSPATIGDLRRTTST